MSSGSPGFSRWDACRDRADCRERLIRLKPGLLFGGIRIKNSNFISRILFGGIRIVKYRTSGI